MGRTTYGWVEYRHVDWSDDQFEGDGWRALVNLQEMMGGRAPFSGYLFGVDNDAKFEPIAPDRGLPDRMSRIARLDYEDVPSDDASWVTLRELERADWDAVPELTAITSQRGWEKAVRRTEKFTHQGRLVERDVDAWTQLPADTVDALAAEQTVRYDGHIYRVVPKRLRELATYDWPTLWSWLTDLRDRWELDSKHVRLVAWFVDD